MFDQFPKISIVTPTFNQGNYIEESILSVIGQKYPNLEYIIMDGGSTDGSVEIIRKYEKKLSFWISEKDNGQSHAINKGFNRATGDILLWLNSDDMLLPNVLKTLNEEVVKRGDAVYFGNCIHFEETDKLKTWGSNALGLARNADIKDVDYIIQPSSFWTRKVYEDIGPLSESLHYGFDWEWFIRARKADIPFIPVNKALSLYRIHEKHKSADGSGSRSSELLSIFKEHNPEKAELFELLIHERRSRKSNSYFQNLVSGILNKPLSYGHYLKFSNYQKYRKFTAKDINALAEML